MSKWILLGLIAAVLVLSGSCQKSQSDAKAKSAPKTIAAGAANAPDAADNGAAEHDSTESPADAGEPATDEDTADSPVDGEPGQDDTTSSTDDAGDSEASNSDTSLSNPDEDATTYSSEFYREYLTENEIAMLKAGLLEAAPEIGYTFNADSDSFNSEWLGPEGVKTVFLMNAIARYLAKDSIELDERVAFKFSIGVFEELRQQSLQAAEAAAAPPPDRAAPGDREENKEPTPAEPTPAFVIPKTIVGEWKSIKEMHDRYSIDKNDAHFEYYQFQESGLAILSYFRQGRISSRNEFPYTYDPRTGVLSLMNSSGEVESTMTVKAPADDDETIHIKPADKQVTTVFEYKPIPKAGGPGTGSGVAPTEK